MAEQNIENRVIELESKMAYQDDTIEQLNQVVIELRAQLEKALRQLESVQKRLPKDEGIEVDPNEPPPPHY